MLGKKIFAAAAAGTFLAASMVPPSYAGPKGPAHINNRNGIRHVLLISIDGMHALDFANCSKGISGVNNGQPFCPNIAKLAQTGVDYVDASTSKPSDSFPGLMAIVTGGSPRTVGAYYDVAYDRVLAPPEDTTGNGLAGGSCSPNVDNGTRTEYEEGIDFDQSKLNGGAPSGDGGLNSIDPKRLPRDPYNSCKPVFPYNFVRTNTVFGVIHQSGGFAAWSDKHPAYVAVAGPGDGSNLDDFYGPEINSEVENYIPQSTMPSDVPQCANSVPDTNEDPTDDYTGSFQNIQCYDSLKVQAILNEIDGKTHDGSAKAPVPNIFGMNFQAVSIGEKLVYQYSPTPSGYSTTGGYKDSIGTPTDSLLQEIEFVDNSIGLMEAELKKQGLLNSTLFIVTAKHGQSPIDPNRLLRIPADNGGMAPSDILGSTYLPASEIGPLGPTEDDVSLLWLAPGVSTQAAVNALQTASPVSNNISGIGQIFSGPSLSLLFGTPGVPPNGDPRVPDIVVVTNVGVIYTGKKKKVSEHGGFAHDDTNVMLLVSNPKLSAATITSPVETAQVAPTILSALGLNPESLQAVQMEGTQSLPGLSF
jgi:Type I phosphodiesterase / nucleotide pyrophosphatase